MRRRLGGLLAVASVVVAVGAGLGADVPFVSLFDGKTLAGWTAEHTDRFSVRDGVIFNDGGVGWLRTAKSYKDFEFQAEYRALKKGGDSGLFFRASAESLPKEPFWPQRGYQLQVIDAESNLKIFGHGTPPPTSDRKAEALKAVMKGPGEWQKLTLKVVGKHAEVTLNGAPITVSDAIGLADGFLGIQGENGQFEWRELRIRELPAQ
jgi:hypothetical protein